MAGNNMTIVRKQNPLSDPEMAEYWVDVIRNSRDDFRTYVSNPAIFNRFETFTLNSRILDCGCGEGYLSRYLAEKGHSVTGIDLSEPLIKAARELGPHLIQFHVGDISNLPYKADAFDYVVSNFVLMELADLTRPITEIARVLKPGGVLIFQILHPFCFASNSGSTNGQKVSEYFNLQRFEEIFHVGGAYSPFPGVRYHRPLSAYTKTLYNNNFHILEIFEPVPVSDLKKDHPLWLTFKDPWFLLIEAQKGR
jgi:SAM-dependent methyltransferase